MRTHPVSRHPGLSARVVAAEQELDRIGSVMRAEARVISKRIGDETVAIWAANCGNGVADRPIDQATIEVPASRSNAPPLVPVERLGVRDDAQEDVPRKIEG